MKILWRPVLKAMAGVIGVMVYIPLVVKIWLVLIFAVGKHWYW